MEKIQVDILGLSTSPASGGAYALILKEVNGNRRLPIIIGAFEAQSIALEMEGIKPPRPLTHDLIKNILESMGSDLSEITISEPVTPARTIGKPDAKCQRAGKRSQP